MKSSPLPKFLTVILPIIFCLAPLYSIEFFCDDPQARLMNDLLIADFWSKKQCEEFPVTYNNFLYGGLINMPSARMGTEGELGFGYTHVHPYTSWNLRCQLTDRLEISGNYRVFVGVDDPILTPLGFGDMSDKGANFKFALLRPEDSRYALPGIAIGFDDIMGTRNFKAQYVVLTHVFLKQNLEVTLGYGGGRFHKWFGGFNWMPFRQSCYNYLKGITFTAEYDATPYKDPEIEKHPKGRKSKSPINVGLKYRLWDHLDFGLSYVRGRHLAVTGSASYNFGLTEGFLPKIDDCLPYTAPLNTEPLGPDRPEHVLVQDLIYPFCEQGFTILDVWLCCNDYEEKVLRLNVVNNKYSQEASVRVRLNHLLAALIPHDIDRVIIVMESDGFPIQEYHFAMEFVRDFGNKLMGQHELKVLSPLTEVDFPDACCDALLFTRPRGWCNMTFLPKTHTFFGSSKGKFKYSLGVNVLFNGYVWYDTYYSLRLGYTLWNVIESSRSVDRLNPSQLPNVRTDIIKYYQQKGMTLDEFYLQKNWNLGRGFYSKVAAGYFEEEYGGVATELLYYPVNCDWAIGIEGALLRKRTYRGLGFTREIRQLHGFQPFHKKFTPCQYFLNLYYDCKPCQLDLHIKAGKFLANDYGIRYEISRYFPSGMRVTIWYTYTNGHDKINGQTYYDKGIWISMPLDMFMTSSCRQRWGYGMSAWLRDVGVVGCTGRDLYEMINSQRQ